MDAHAITDIIVRITPTGGFPGGNPKIIDNINNPIPLITPRPMPPYRVPSKRQPKITKNCNIIIT